jgi:hypothetical protein
MIIAVILYCFNTSTWCQLSVDNYWEMGHMTNKALMGFIAPSQHTFYFKMVTFVCQMENTFHVLTHLFVFTFLEKRDTARSLTRLRPRWKLTSEQVNLIIVYYKAEDRGFETRWGEKFFPIYLILPVALGPVVYSASNRNEYQKQK